MLKGQACLNEILEALESNRQECLYLVDDLLSNISRGRMFVIVC